MITGLKNLIQYDFFLYIDCLHIKISKALLGYMINKNTSRQDYLLVPSVSGSTVIPNSPVLCFAFGEQCEGNGAKYVDSSSKAENSLPFSNSVLQRRKEKMQMKKDFVCSPL